MRGWFYVVMLALACLAAGMLGYAFGTVLETPQKNDLPPEVRYYGTVEAQGADLPDPHFDSYEDYEAHVAEIVNDRSMQ